MATTSTTRSTIIGSTNPTEHSGNHPLSSTLKAKLLPLVRLLARDAAGKTLQHNKGCPSPHDTRLAPPQLGGHSHSRGGMVSSEEGSEQKKSQIPRRPEVATF
jgi:hypothetical protein